MLGACGQNELLRSGFSFCFSLFWHFQADLSFTVAVKVFTTQ